MSRSKELINIEDLEQLRMLAFASLEKLYRNRPETERLYRNRLFAMALCQGAAQHFIDGNNGVKDFDVWMFFSRHPKRPFPYRRRGVEDFGKPKFGKTEGFEGFVGRRVDVMGRSLANANMSDPLVALQDYLTQRRTTSARCLAEKAVVLLWPESLKGHVVWPVEDKK